MNPEYPPENSFPPGSRAGVGYPLIVGLPGVGLGVVFWFAIVMGITSRSLNSGLICLSLGGRQQARRTDVLSQPSRKQSPEDPFLLPAVRIDHEIAEELRVISKIKDIIRPL